MAVSSQNTSLFTEDVETDIPWATKALGSKPEAVNLWIGNERATTSFLKSL
jgi:jumonji domain-containing protein 7